MQDRLNRAEYGLVIARAAALRSTCPRRAVGAVLMKEGRVISTGYNGAPPGKEDCLTGGCLMVDDHCINTLHGELNAILRAREVGDVLVTTDQPCLGCLKAALAHNPCITIFYWRAYPDKERDEFVRFHKLEGKLYKFSQFELNKIEEALRIA